MNRSLMAVVNGLIMCLPLLAAVWLLLRFSRGWLNAATRYSIWWIVMAVVILAPLAYLSRSISMSPVTSVAPPQRQAEAPRETFLSPGVNRVRRPHAPTARTGLFQTDMIPAALVGLSIGLAALMLLRLLVSLVLLQRRRLGAVSASGELSALAGRCLARCGVSRDVVVAVSDRVGSPMVAGPFRPFLLIPARLASALSADEMELVCLHEAAHLTRYDDAALLVQRLIQALLVWNPLIHWISRQIDLEREIACDDFVIGLTSQPRPYASCLTHVAEVAGRYRSSPLAAASTDGRSHLATRVELLLDKTRHIGPRLLRSRLALCVAGLTAMAAGLAQSPPMITAQVQVQRSAPVPMAQAPTPKPVPPPAPPIPAVVTEEPRAAMMRVAVTVTDPLHRFVTGLGVDDFNVLENGIRQPISSFNGEDQPVSMWIVWDVKEFADSALRGRLAQALSERNPGDAFFLIPVDAESLHTAGEDLKKDIKKDNNRRRAVAVVLSQDHQSGLLLPGSAFSNSVGEARVPVYPFTFRDQDGVVAQLQRITVELRNQYVLEYSSKRKSPSAVEVTLNQPRGLPALTPHAAPTLLLPR